MPTVRCSSHFGGGCLPKGVSARGGGSLPRGVGRHPPVRQNDRRLWKHNLSTTTLRTVKSRIGCNVNFTSNGMYPSTSSSEPSCGAIFCSSGFIFAWGMNGMAFTFSKISSVGRFRLLNRCVTSALAWGYNHNALFTKIKSKHWRKKIGGLHYYYFSRCVQLWGIVKSIKFFNDADNELCHSLQCDFPVLSKYSRKSTTILILDRLYLAVWTVSR